MAWVETHQRRPIYNCQPAIQSSILIFWRKHSQSMEWKINRHRLFQIYNCDEYGMRLEYKISKIIMVKSTKKVCQCTSGSNIQIVILICPSASGQTIPSMAVFVGKHTDSALAKGEVPTTLYGMSSSGWMDPEIFAV